MKKHSFNSQMKGFDRFIHSILCAIFPYRDILQRTNDGTQELYLRRFYIIRRGRFKLFLHNLRLPDDVADLHDHPWSFNTFCVSGGYLEELPNKTRTLKFGRYFRNKSTHLHRIVSVSKQTWTLVHTGPATKSWGFYTKNGFVPWNVYLGINNPKVYEEDRIQ